MKSIGIDVGSFSIKVAEVDSSGKNVAIRSLAEYPLNPDPHFDNQINILETLRKVIENVDPATTTFVFGVSQDRVTTRHRFFPFRERSKITKSLPFELEDEIPFDSGTAIFDAKLIKYVGPMAEVIACAVPKAKVEAVINMAHDAGIEPQVVSMESMALANEVESWDALPPQEPGIPETEESQNQKPPPRESSLVVNIGHKKTIVALFKNNRMVASRPIIWGGRNIIEAVAKKYGVLYLEALREVQSKAFVLINPEGATRDQIVFSDTIIDAYSDMIKELKLSIMELTGEHNCYVTSVQLTGGGCRVKNINAYFTQELEIPTNYFDPFQNMHNVNFEKTQALITGSSIALGLAIEGLKKPKNPPINFRKDEFGLKNITFELFWEKWHYAAKLAGAALLVFCVYSYLRDDFALKIADTSEERMRSVAKNFIPKKRITQRDINTYISENKKVIEQSKKIAGLLEMNSALDILRKVNESLPDRSMDIVRLEVENQSFLVEGTVKRQDLLTPLETGLKAASSDARVKKITPTAARGPLAFGYQITVDRNVKVTR